MPPNRALQFVQMPAELVKAGETYEPYEHVPALAYRQRGKGVVRVLRLQACGYYDNGIPPTN